MTHRANRVRRAHARVAGRSPFVRPSCRSEKETHALYSTLPHPPLFVAHVHSTGLPGIIRWPRSDSVPFGEGPPHGMGVFVPNNCGVFACACGPIIYSSFFFFQFISFRCENSAATGPNAVALVWRVSKEAHASRAAELCLPVDPRKKKQHTRTIHPMRSHSSPSSPTNGSAENRRPQQQHPSSPGARFCGPQTHACIHIHHMHTHDYCGVHSAYSLSMQSLCAPQNTTTTNKDAGQPRCRRRRRHQHQHNKRRKRRARARARGRTSRMRIRRFGYAPTLKYARRVNPMEKNKHTKHAKRAPR